MATTANEGATSNPAARAQAATMAKRRGWIIEGPYQSRWWLSRRPSARVKTPPRRDVHGCSHAPEGDHRHAFRRDGDRVLSRQGAGPREEFRRAREEGVLRRDDFPPRHPRLH